ncbi:hypothetical protein WUBG_09321, partial [Wuchereria bancrofti]
DERQLMQAFALKPSSIVAAFSSHISHHIISYHLSLLIINTLPLTTVILLFIRPPASTIPFESVVQSPMVTNPTTATTTTTTTTQLILLLLIILLFIADVIIILITSG